VLKSFKFELTKIPAMMLPFLNLELQRNAIQRHVVAQLLSQPCWPALGAGWSCPSPKKKKS